MAVHLQTLREQHHMGRESLARKLEVHYSTVYQWEKRGLHKARYQTRERIASLYGVDIAELSLEPRPQAEEAVRG